MHIGLTLRLVMLGFAAAVAAGASAGEIVLAPTSVREMKAVFGRIESRFVVPARTRIGGTLVELAVAEGSVVAAGAVLARVVDDKLALQTAASEARIRAVQSEYANAQIELERNQALIARGATTQQRVDQLRTQVEVLRNQLAQAEAERAVILQQATEGAVVAPAAGRVLTVPARRGAVVMPGEPVATIAAGGVFIRLAIPERHARLLSPGAPVAVAGEGGSGLAATSGTLEKIYPQIENGRVIADVVVGDLPDTFIGQRVLVQVPVGVRSVLAVPPGAVITRAGLDFVAIAAPEGRREIAVVPGAQVETADGPRREVLTGLRAGDRVITP